MSTRLTNFAGLASLPVIRDELVVRRHVLTDDKLNEAVVITRSTPGPAGLYVVSSCYFAGDAARAIAGWLAMITPELLILPLLRFAAGKAEHPRLRSAFRYGRRKRRAPAGRRRAYWSGRSYRAVTAAITVVTAGLTVATKIGSLRIIVGAALTTPTMSSVAPLVAL